MNKIRIKIGKAKDPNSESEADSNPEPKKSKIRTKREKQPSWITEKIEQWRLPILLISLLYTILMTAHSTILWHTQKIDLAFWTDIVLVSVCLIAAEVLMYGLYSDKKSLELEAWTKLSEDLKSNYSDTYRYKQTLESLRLFGATYYDSFWIRHTPPFALVIYVGYAIALPTIWLKIDWRPWVNQFAVASVLILFLLFNIKFINDLVNLTMGYKKMKTLKKRV